MERIQRGLDPVKMTNQSWVRKEIKDKFDKSEKDNK
jgi:hypothetical protein